MSRSRSAIPAFLAIFMAASVQFASAMPVLTVFAPKHMKVCDSETFLNCHEVEGVVPPKVRHSEDPQWPSEARRQHIQGFCEVRLIVDDKGMPQRVRIVRSTAVGLTSAQLDVGVEMDESALKSVKEYRFKPAMLNGQAVPVEVNVMVNFHILY